MLITARSNVGPATGRGVLGHATSSDLLTWTVRPPLSAPAGFGHLEVPQVTVVDGQPLLLFCTNAISPDRAANERIWYHPRAQRHRMVGPRRRLNRSRIRACMPRDW